MRVQVPCPIPPGEPEAIAPALKSRGLAGFSQNLTVRRLGVSITTVQNAERAKLRTIVSETQSMLAVAFLECASRTQRGQRAEGAILDALVRSGYHPLMVEYLVQMAHRLHEPICLSPWDRRQIAMLCRAAVTGNDAKPLMTFAALAR